MQYLPKHSKDEAMQNYIYRRSLTKLLLTYAHYALNKVKIMKKNKLKNKVKATNKTLQSFIKSTIKNYLNMKKKLSKIWLILFIAIGFCACNVTRVITNQSEYYQKGDTAITIQTKTIETYNAERK